MNLIKIIFKAAQKTAAQIGELVEAAMIKAAKAVVEDTIGGYNSDFRKELEEKLKQSLSAGLDGMVLTDYTAHIIDAVKAKHSEILKEVDLSGIENTIKGVIDPLKSEYKLSELVVMYKESVGDYDKESLSSCFFDFKRNCGYDNDDFEIKFGTDEDSDDYEIRVMGDMKDGTCYLLDTETTFNKYKKGKPATVDGFSDFQMLMLKICNSRETKIVFDKDRVDTSYYHEDDY